MGWLPGCLPHRQRWVAAPRSGFTAWYVCRETRTITYPTKGGTRHIQAPRKVSVEVPNLSKGEMCSNYSLNICPRFLQPFTAPSEGRAPQALRSRLLGAHHRHFHVDGGRSWTSSSSTSRGPAVDVLTLMMDTPEPSASAPSRGSSSTFSC
jgi:hypothetical protein